MNFYLGDCRVVRFSGSKNKWWKLFFENIERKNVLKKCEKCVLCREEVCSGSDRCSVARQASPRIRFLSLPPRVPDPVGSLIKFPFQPRLPLPPPLSPLGRTVQPPLLYGCVHDALIKTRKLMLYAFESLLSRALSRSLFATRVRPLESCSIFLINLVAIQLFNRLTAHFFFFNKMSSPTTCDQTRLDLSSLILAIRSFRFSKFSVDEQHAMNMIFLEIFYQFRSISSLFSKLHNLITFHQIRTLVNGIPSNGSKNGSLRDPCSKEDKQA